VEKLWAYRDAVIHSDDARSSPGGSFSLLPFRPGSHSAAEHHLASARLDRDTVRVDQCAAPECLLDLVFNVCGRYLRFEADQVADALNPFDPTERSFGVVPLVIPLDFAFQRHPAILDDRFDMPPGIGQPALELCDDVAGNFRIRPFVGARQTDLEIVC
jgi:hypothetical protein